MNGRGRERMRKSESEIVHLEEEIKPKKFKAARKEKRRDPPTISKVCLRRTGIKVETEGQRLISCP